MAAFLVLTACSRSSITAQHWRDYLAHPNSDHFFVLIHDLKGCKDSTCPAMADISEHPKKEPSIAM